MERPYIRGKSGTHPLDKDFQHKPEGVTEALGDDGIHKRVLTHLPITEENMDKALCSDTPEAFWSDIERILEHCDSIMLSHEWDRKGGCDFPDDRSAVPYSKLWNAGKIGRKCWYLLKHVKPENPDTWLLRKVLNLGIDMADADWRLAFGPAIKTGAPVRQGGKRGGEMRAKKFAPHTLAVNKEMKRLCEQGHTIQRAAQLTAPKGLGTSAEANRKLWSRHQRP